MSIDDRLERLAAFAPTSFPVISLYLNTQPDQRGRADFDSFIRKEIGARGKTYPARSPERESFEHDAERIKKYLDLELRPSSNGVALFACWGADGFFEDVQLEAPIQKHRLYVFDQPHLYDLARLNDRYRRYAVLVADTNSARLFVFGMRKTLSEEDVTNRKVSRTKVGGWSQARYQRHTKNFHLHHAKDLVDALDRTVREDNIDLIVLAGDKVIIPVLQAQLPAHLASKVIDVLRLDIKTPEHEILSATLEAMRERDADEDIGKVAALLDAYRSGGLAVAGPEDTLAALEQGQVDELLLSASLRQLAIRDNDPAAHSEERLILADALVTKARQTGAHISFIEKEDLLADIGGTGASLRYRT